MKIFTTLSALYNQSEDLQDAEWRIRNKIESYAKRGWNTTKLVAEQKKLISEIFAVRRQMNELDGYMA